MAEEEANARELVSTGMPPVICDQLQSLGVDELYDALPRADCDLAKEWCIAYENFRTTLEESGTQQARRKSLALDGLTRFTWANKATTQGELAYDLFVLCGATQRVASLVEFDLNNMLDAMAKRLHAEEIIPHAALPLARLYQKVKDYLLGGAYNGSYPVPEEVKEVAEGRRSVSSLLSSPAKRRSSSSSPAKRRRVEWTQGADGAQDVSTNLDDTFASQAEVAEEQDRIAACAALAAAEVAAAEAAAELGALRAAWEADAAARVSDADALGHALTLAQAAERAKAAEAQDAAATSAAAKADKLKVDAARAQADHARAAAVADLERARAAEREAAANLHNVDAHAEALRRQVAAAEADAATTDAAKRSAAAAHANAVAERDEAVRRKAAGDAAAANVAAQHQVAERKAAEHAAEAAKQRDAAQHALAAAQKGDAAASASPHRSPSISHHLDALSSTK